MALWSIEQAAENEAVKLRFIQRPLDVEPAIQDCGEGEGVLLADLTHFVCQQASPFDLVRMPGGAVFVRQYAPGERA